MTRKNPADPADDDALGVLDEAAPSLDTSGIGILGGTAQVRVTLPTGADDDLVDETVVEGEMLTDIVVTEPAPVGRILDSAGIVIEIPADAAGEADAADDSAVTAELVEPEPEPEPEATVAVEPEAADPVTVGSATAGTETVEPEEAAQRALRKVSATADAPASSASAEPAPATTATGASSLRLEAITERLAADRAAAERAIAEASRAPASPAPVSDDGAARTGAVEKRPTALTRRAQHQEEIVSASDQNRTRHEVALTSKRLGEQQGQAARESADLLTTDRLVDPHRLAKPEPEGAWSHFLYTVSGRRINIGDGKRARARKQLTARIAAPLTGGARFVPVLSRKGGVGKTTITTLLGMALADARDDRVIAVDANPDRGTLAERVVRTHSKSVRDLVRQHDEISGYHDISAIVARDSTRLDVLASDDDPRVSEAFSDEDYRNVASVAAHYYSLVLTDTGTGIVHSVMGATLDLADQLVIVSGLSVDEARLASETLTWLETNGYAELVRDAIVVLNQSTPGAPLVRLDELQSHFGTRARQVVRVPYDEQIAAGGTIEFAGLRPETRQAARELAALLVEGLRMRAA